MLFYFHKKQIIEFKLPTTICIIKIQKIALLFTFYGLFRSDFE